MTLWQRVPDLPNCQRLMDVVSTDMMLHKRQPVSLSVSIVLILPSACYSLELPHVFKEKKKKLLINTINGQFMLGDYQMRIDLSFCYGCVTLGNQ